MRKIETIGSQLERDRLERRVRRIQKVTEALRDRAVHRQSVNGMTPPALRHAIADFEIETRRLQRRVAELRRTRRTPAAPR